jgi:hypothetical protein
MGQLTCFQPQSSDRQVAQLDQNHPGQKLCAIFRLYGPFEPALDSTRSSNYIKNPQ